MSHSGNAPIIVVIALISESSRLQLHLHYIWGGVAYIAPKDGIMKA